MPMLLLAAALIASPPAPGPTRGTAQATATVRVISAVRVKLDGSHNADSPRPRRAEVRSPDGTVRTVKLIEFQ
jgi:hypothetical protein